VIAVGPVKRNARRPYHQAAYKRKLSAFDSVKRSAIPVPLLDRVAKRTFDIILAAIALVVLSPLLLLISIAIGLGARGSIFCRQTCYTYDGEPIEVLKFRSTAPTENGDETDPTTNAGVTPVSRVLRRTGIDELPLLVAVLRGEMSIIGPCLYPIAPSQVLGENATILAKHNIKPGIIGWAQVNGYSAEDEAVKPLLQCLKHDLYYLNNWSISLEMKIAMLMLTSKQLYRPED